MYYVEKWYKEVAKQSKGTFVGHGRDMKRVVD